MDNRTFIKKPINNRKEYLINITSYINGLENAINNELKLVNSNNNIKKEREKNNQKK